MILTLYPTLAVMEETVKSARPLIFDRDLASDVSEKGICDYVTKADTSVQCFIRSALEKSFPDCAFMGEESPDHKVDPDVPIFILDPIDGTTNFIHGFCLSATSLALAFGGETILAVIYNPFTDELFSAEKGKGAFLNGKPIHVSDAPDLAHSLVSVGTMPYRKETGSGYFGLYRELYLRGVDIRRTGSAALDACYVAAGRSDCYLENGLGTWDIAASRLIVAEAGGIMTDWHGAPTTLDRAVNDVAASNGRVHAELLTLIKDQLENRNNGG